MAYKQSPGRMNMPKTGGGVPSALTMPEPDPKKPELTKKETDKKEQIPSVTSRRFDDEYYNVPNSKPYKRNSDGSVQMITTKGSTYSLRRGTDKQ